MRPLLLGLGFTAVLLGLAFGHLRLLSQPVPRLLGIVPDDAFYYFQIARHLVAGHGSTFDGVHPTSGYHPGWMALLLPLAAVLKDPASLMRGALVLEFLLHAATAIALIGLFRRHTSPGLALAGSLCWLANPLAISLALQGVESALYAFSLVLVLRAMASFIAAPGEALLPHVQLGGALALCFLARTEAGIFAALTFAMVPALRGWRPWDRRTLRSVLLLAAVFTLCVAPWFVYCWVATGSPWQTSGVVKALWADHFLGHLSAGERLGRAAAFTGVYWLAAPWVRTLASPLQGISTFAWAAMIPAAIGLLLAVRRAEDRPLIVWSAWLLATATLTGLIYGLFYWDVQLWYRAQPAVLLFVLTFVWIARAGTAASAGPARVLFRTVVPLVLLALSLREAWSLYGNPPVLYPWQADFYASQPEFEKLVPLGEAIGCFNAGIPAFFSQRRIVNLDGLVNSSVVPYYRQRNFERYFSDQGIHYIADVSNALERTQAFMSRPLRLRVLAAAPLRGWFAPHRMLWQVEPEPPASP